MYWTRNAPFAVCMCCWIVLSFTSVPHKSMENQSEITHGSHHCYVAQKPAVLDICFWSVLLCAFPPIIHWQPHCQLNYLLEDTIHPGRLWPGNLIFLLALIKRVFVSADANLISTAAALLEPVELLWLTSCCRESWLLCNTNEFGPCDLWNATFS